MWILVGVTKGVRWSFCCSWWRNLSILWRYKTGQLSHLVYVNCGVRASIPSSSHWFHFVKLQLISARRSKSGWKSEYLRHFMQFNQICRSVIYGNSLWSSGEIALGSRVKSVAFKSNSLCMNFSGKCKVACCSPLELTLDNSVFHSRISGHRQLAKRYLHHLLWSQSVWL